AFLALCGHAGLPRPLVNAPVAGITVDFTDRHIELAPQTVVRGAHDGAPAPGGLSGRAGGFDRARRTLDEAMPEGDTIHHAANRIGPVLVGAIPDEIATPHPRFGKDRWPARLAGRRVDAVDAHGKHLFIRFEGDLVIHSHLRMTGWWGVFGRGE